MRGQPGEEASWQVVDEREQVGKIAHAECLPDAQVQFLVGNPALDEARLEDIDRAIPVHG